MKQGALYAAGRCLLPRVWRAERAWERARGLLGRAPLGRDEALLIERCGAVHTFGMGYALDLAFLDRDGRVLRVVERLAPLRIAAARGAAATLEMAAGAAAALGLRAGDRVEWRPA